MSEGRGSRIEDAGLQGVRIQSNQPGELPLLGRVVFDRHERRPSHQKRVIVSLVHEGMLRPRHMHLRDDVAHVQAAGDSDTMDGRACQRRRRRRRRRTPTRRSAGSGFRANYIYLRSLPQFNAASAKTFPINFSCF
jgi:hypothetical protein